MDKAERDKIEATLPPSRRFKMPPEMTDEMRRAAYGAYCDRLNEKGYIAWEDVCACFIAAFSAGARGQAQK